MIHTELVRLCMNKLNSYGIDTCLFIYKLFRRKYTISISNRNNFFVNLTKNILLVSPLRLSLTYTGLGTSIIVSISIFMSGVSSPVQPVYNFPITIFTVITRDITATPVFTIGNSGTNYKPTCYNFKIHSRIICLLNVSIYFRFRAFFLSIRL